MSADPGTPEQRYAGRAEHFAKLAAELGRKVDLISNLRGISFGGLVILGLFALFGDSPAVTGAGAALSGLIFTFSVVWHGRVIAKWENALRWSIVNDRGRLRVGPDWRSLPELGQDLVAADHPYAADLDLFGQSSLFQRINLAHTRFGQRALARLLSEPCTVTEARERQRVVSKLGDQLELRQELEALTLALSLPRIWTNSDVKPVAAPDPEPLLRWAESSKLPKLSPVQVLLLRLLPLFTVTLTMLATSMGWPKALWLVPLGLQIAIVFKFREPSAHTFHSVSLGQGVFVQYGPTLRLLAHATEIIPELAGVRDRFADIKQAELAMRRFQRWVGWLELRTNPLVHPIANAFLLWDLHCVIELERWQREWGTKLRGWFEALGELEAYSSLATVGFDNPSFCWPDLDEGRVRFLAVDLAHPLIDADTRVGNSVMLPEAGTALLVTGSNMSGKSTLLRSMGLAQVMALAGAPVCAKELNTTDLVVRTSLRISDSLEQGVSHFYAELRKLKGVVEAVRQSPRVLFLLDEILHGTNSIERQVGARWLLREVLQQGAIGAVSTHDTGLCELTGELMQRITQVHFRETVEGDRMIFDYALRPGPVQGGNALRLMHTLGLNVPLDSQQ